MESHRDKIEQYGSMMESMGLTPVAARTFVYLLFCQQEQATFDDLVTYFRVSKSAVSNSLKLLTAANMVESKTIGGQRKRYFSVNFNKLFDHQELTERFQKYYMMLDDIQKSRGHNDSLAHDLANVSRLYRLMTIELPIILDRWRQMRDMR